MRKTMATLITLLLSLFPALQGAAPAAPTPEYTIQAIRSAPRSPWHGRGGTYLPWLPRLVVGTMVVGGLAGGLLLGGTIGHRTSLEGIIVGAASFAVLGGWISFLAGNFYGVFRHGFREALAEQQKDQTDKTCPAIGQPGSIAVTNNST